MNRRGVMREMRRHERKDTMLTLKMLGGVAIAVALLAVPAQAISTDIVHSPVAEPATMMLFGTGLLAVFKNRRQV